MKAVNLLLLAMMIGIELCVGVMVAPVIFYPQEFLGEGVLTQFQSGILMTQIFIKFGYILLGVSVINTIFALFSKELCSFSVRISKILLALIILVLSAVFVFYFTDYIVKAQELGEVATQNAEFAGIHSASEVVIKIMVVAQAFLFFLSFKTAKKI
ncbi:DUF4149 domain-containing protein [Campylobacter sp. US33a]|uniref:DUF4149 domain-containing protein n=1 Tax=Campylobacter sp. US33a TaxID=2498120 RepID=UPI0010682896|nr:DUF4149 domain-containing protein [Campylobacter sp. US33a]TEY01573.1 DUF4149 domain-containing protein [Campylobacter sp. US33a]